MFQSMYKMLNDFKIMYCLIVQVVTMHHIDPLKLTVSRGTDCFINFQYIQIAYTAIKFRYKTKHNHMYYCTS